MSLHAIGCKMLLSSSQELHSRTYIAEWPSQCPQQTLDNDALRSGVRLLPPWSHLCHGHTRPGATCVQLCAPGCWARWERGETDKWQQCDAPVPLCGVWGPWHWLARTVRSPPSCQAAPGSEARPGTTGPLPRSGSGSDTLYSVHWLYSGCTHLAASQGQLSPTVHNIIIWLRILRTRRRNNYGISFTV